MQTDGAPALDAPPDSFGGAQPADAPGSIAHRYEVRRFLGRGGRKDVYLSHDSELDREVAVALFDAEGLGEAALARARREMQAMEKLGDHPHLVTVYDTGESEGRPYIASRYMPGGDVQRLLASSEDGRLPVERALEIGIDVCRALEHAHACGIVHRDLKPANVWLAEDGGARLGDFSLAETAAQGSSGALVGTVAYLPPERALGRPCGPKSDLYSLGALLYEMVAGQPPFTGGDAVSIIGRHLNADPVAPSRHNGAVPPALDDLILQLLAKSADARPESAASVRAALEAIRDAPPQPPEPSTGEQNPLEGLAGRVFVGRETELEQLRGAADETLTGRGRLVLIAGEPGIGKTRTAEELATYAQVRGANVYWGRCHEDDAAPAYWPWVQVIRSYVREADPVALAWEMGSGAADIARVVPEVSERVGEVTAPAAADDEAARFRLFDSISGFLASAANSKPLAIVLDDLHWADEPSLLLLQFLVRGLGDARLLLIGTYRDVELGRHHPLSRVLGELSGSGEARVALHGLTESDVGHYIAMTTGIEPAPTLVRTVHDQTEGNPFFLAEVVRLLAAEGTIGDPGSAALAIPQGVRDVVGRRLDRLPKEANEALAVGAAIGRDFDPEVVAKVMEVDRGTLEEPMSAAVSAQLLAETSAGGYRFSHALVRETLYEELSATQRPALHRRIAETLEASYSSDPQRLQRRLAELAHHFLEGAAGGDAEKAIDYAVRAAERASGQLGHEEAAELYERALEALELCEPDQRRHCELLVALGEAQMRAGKLGEARTSFDRAADAARGLDATELLVQAAVGLAYVSEVGATDERIVEVLEAALEAVGPEDSLERARLLSWLGQEYLWVDPQGRSRELFEASNEMARRLEDDSTLAFTLSRGAFIELHPEAAQGLIETQDEVLELAHRVGDRELQLRAHVLRLTGYLTLGDIPAVDRDLEAYARLAAELRQPQHLWHVPLLRGMRAMIDGRFDVAEEFAAEVRAGGERAQEPLAQQFFAIQAALRFRLEGRLDEIAPAIEQLAARYPAIAAWRIAAALTHADLGQLDEARAEFERIAADDFAGIPMIAAQWLTAIAILCEIASILGDAERAEKLHSMLAPFRGQTVVAGRAAACWGPISRSLGVASATAGKHDRAVDELEDGIALSERMGDRPFLAQGHLNLAAVLLERGSSGDRERALDLLDRCLDAAQEMGMRALTDQALAAKLAAQGLAGVDATTSIDEVIAAVESERPDILAYAAADGTVTILFSDIEDSTILTERLGDERWLELLRAHNTIFRRHIREHGGYEVKNQGDGFMLVFPQPTEALLCAIEVQRTLAERASESPDDGIRVRMGLHTGEAIAEEGDFFGRNVVLAARIAAQARGGEILVSEALREQAEGGDGLSFDDGRELELKGMAGTHTVHRAEWEAEEATA